MMLALPAMAQDSAEEERSFFLAFVENQLSAPNRQIRISDIQGVLSSSATIGEITVADREGVWLRIVDASIDWNRSALLGGRLDIDRLAAERTEVLRQPVPEEGLPPPEAGSFAVPDLPIAIVIDALEVPSVTFAADVFGLQSELAVTGMMRLESGSLDSTLDIRRLDGPGGQLTLGAAYDAGTDVFDLNMILSEPEDGVVANLLDIPGRPPIRLSLVGEGPVGDLELALTLDAAGERVMTGASTFRRRAGGLAFSADVEGSIADLMPARFRPFFGAETTLLADGMVKDSGGLRLESIDLRSAALTLSGTAETAAGGFVQRLRLDAGIADPDGGRVILPVPGGETSVERGELSVTFGDTADGTWSGRLDISGMTTDTFAAQSLTLEAGGSALNLDRPDTRRVTFELDGTVAGITAERADVAEALGDRIALQAGGEWQSGQPVMLRRAMVTGASLSVSLAGDIADFGFNGDLAVETSTLAPFSGLAGRDLAGGIRLEATGQLAPISGAFNLRLDGTAEDLSVDIAAADRLLVGTTAISGRLARTSEGIAADQLLVENEQVTLSADGTFATGSADLGFELVIAHLAQLSEQAGGRLTATGRASGSEGMIGLSLSAEVPGGSLAGKRLSEASLTFDGTLRDGTIDGAMAGSAFLDGVLAEISSAILLADGGRSFEDIRFATTGTTVTGALAQRPDGLLEGDLAVRAPNIETAAALLLTEASGAIDADVSLGIDQDRQNADVRAAISDFEARSLAIREGRIEAQIENLFGVPMVQGDLEAEGVTAAGVDIARLTANADRSGATTNFNAAAALANGATASANGTLTPESEGYQLVLQSARLERGDLAARLIEPASLLVRGSAITVDGLALDIGDGHVAVDGQIADTLDLRATISDAPLAIANTVRSDLELGGTVNGNVAVSGTRASPDIRFDLQASAVTAAALRQAGLTSVTVEADGRSRGNRLTVDAAISSPEGVRARVSGSVPVGDDALALDVALQAFPLATLNPVAPGQNLTGRISGSAQVSGTVGNPTATFDLSGSGVSSARLAAFGIAPLDLRARGRYADNAVELTSANVGGPQGLSIAASGRLPDSGTGMNLSLGGRAPLSLANRLLAARGARLTGTLSLDLSVSGSLRQPEIGGTIWTGGADFVDPGTGLRLRNIAVSASIANETVSLNSASASLAGGGTVGVAGSVSLRPEASFPANLRITLDRARYADGELVAATLTGSLTLTGPLTRDPLLSGNVAVERAEIIVPASLGGGAAQIDVTHVDPPPAVARTLERARASDGTPVPSARPSVLRLDVAVSAPNQIFVRGRGLDVELGGQVRLTGPVTAVQPVGGFSIIRGRLSILGQRITFDEGRVTLVGDLDPFLNFVARSGRGDVTVIITVTGRVSDPDISFSSQPELPEDEVLALLIFNRGLGELSPLQIGRLALAAGELAGGSDTSLLGSLRQAAGLDDLDIVTTPEGGTSLRVGRYIQDNVYLGVEAGTEGSSRATINLDITEGLKAKGSLGADGDSSLGIFYEKDY